VIENLEDTLRKAKKFVFLTGAGISQENGISTFRGKDGLWQKYDPMKLASAQAFRDDPKLVWSWYNHRRKNAGHLRNQISRITEKYPLLLRMLTDYIILQVAEM